MHPMTFAEYLQATDRPLADALERGDQPLIDAFPQRYTEALKRYYFVGGMPEAVAAFADSGDYAQVRGIQKRLLFDYEHDFSKYADAQLAEKIRMIWASAPAQLGRENKRFIYSAVRTGARARGYEEAIQWLVDAGLLLRVNRISKPGVPLISHEDRDAFKLYLLDVGLLGAASDLDQQTLLDGSALFTEFKGSLTENYVCQELIASGKVRPFYWSAENSSNEVNFIYGHGRNVVPVEVKAELNLRSEKPQELPGQIRSGKRDTAFACRAEGPRLGSEPPALRVRPPAGRTPAKGLAPFPYPATSRSFCQIFTMARVSSSQ